MVLNLREYRKTTKLKCAGCHHYLVSATLENEDDLFWFWFDEEIEDDEDEEDC